MELTIVNQDGKYFADSREISELTGKRHDHLLRDIDGYVEVLQKATNPNLGASEFFIEGNYVDSKGEVRRKYDCTRKGCDMIANKMTGKKGILFTATYVTKFEEMERTLKQPSNIVQIPTELNMFGQLIEGFNQSFKVMTQMQKQIEDADKKAEEATKKAEETEARSREIEKDLNDVRNGLVDINLPLRVQFNDAVKLYKGKNQLDWDKAYNNIYTILGKQEGVNIKLRADRRGVRPIDILEELNLLVPAIRLAKTLAGVAS